MVNAVLLTGTAEEAVAHSLWAGTAVAEDSPRCRLDIRMGEGNTTSLRIQYIEANEGESDRNDRATADREMKRGSEEDFHARVFSLNRKAGGSADRRLHSLGQMNPERRFNRVHYGPSLLDRDGNSLILPSTR